MELKAGHYWRSIPAMASRIGSRLDNNAPNRTSVLAKIHTCPYRVTMATTLNISLSQDQAAWVKSRKEEGGFASASDVIRDLIRQERARTLAKLEAEFAKMDKQDGADGPAPV